MLTQCLRSLADQSIPPGEVLVIWQSDDVLTRDTAENLKNQLQYPLRVLYNPEPGIVPAENTGLDAAIGKIIYLIDDDAIASPHWIAHHLAHYSDPKVGAVGGPAVNYFLDGRCFPVRRKEPLGTLTWYGRFLANMYDHPIEWRSRSPIDVDFLVGYNMSLRREAFDRFESRLKRYWQMFETDACLKVKANGYRVVFDPAIVVDHYPTNTAYVGGRDGDLKVKIANPAFNQAFILAKHSPWKLLLPRLLNSMLIGSTGSPGPALFFPCLWRFGSPRRELEVLKMSVLAKLDGWLSGYKVRNGRA
jgi:glycosyltransferase involved in cell wall biosynthesis